VLLLLFVLVLFVLIVLFVRKLSGNRKETSKISKGSIFLASKRKNEI
jgi:hypothetical protein